MMVGWVFLVLTDACQFGHGVGEFTANFIHSIKKAVFPFFRGGTQSIVLSGTDGFSKAWFVRGNAKKRPNRFARHYKEGSTANAAAALPRGPWFSGQH